MDIRDQLGEAETYAIKISPRGESGNREYSSKWTNITPGQLTEIARVLSDDSDRDPRATIPVEFRTHYTVGRELNGTYTVFAGLKDYRTGETWSEGDIRAIFRLATDAVDLANKLNLAVAEKLIERLFSLLGDDDS
jgi:hypothetical protein